MAIVPAMKIRPTAAQKATSARLLSRVASRSVDWTNLTHGEESRNESNAVLPNSTGDDGDQPGPHLDRRQVGQRAADHAGRPSSRAQTDSFDSSVEYTSNGSALS